MYGSAAYETESGSCESFVSVLTARVEHRQHAGEALARWNRGRMETTLLVLVGVNLLISLVLVGLAMRRGTVGSGSAASASEAAGALGGVVRGELQQQGAQIRQEQQEQRGELREMLRTSSEAQGLRAGS